MSPLKPIGINKFAPSMLFVAVRYGSTAAATSANGTTWTSRTMPSSSAWYGLTSSGTLIVTVDSGGTTVARSADGITWNTSTAPNAFSYPAIYGNGVFNALDNARGQTSSDAITWTARTIPSASPGGWRYSVYGGSLWVAPTNGSNSVVTSSDAITWTKSSGVLPSSSAWSGISYGASTYVTTDSGSTAAATSTNGTTWTSRTSAGGTRQVQYINGVFVGVADNFIQTSTNGTSWTSRSKPNINYEQVAGNATIMVAVGTGTSSMAYSTDGGSSWSSGTLPSSGDWYSICVK